MYLKYYTKRFQKSFKKVLRAGKVSREEVELVVDLLARGKKLSREYQDHSLHGSYENLRECHIRGDILLVYKIEKQKIVLVLFDIGAHSELF